MDENPYRSPTTFGSPGDGRISGFEAINAPGASLVTLFGLHFAKFGCFILGAFQVTHSLFAASIISRAGLIAGAMVSAAGGIALMHAMSRMRRRVQEMTPRGRTNHGAAYWAALGIWQLGFAAVFVFRGDASIKSLMLFFTGLVSAALAAAIISKGRQGDARLSQTP